MIYYTKCRLINESNRFLSIRFFDSNESWSPVDFCQRENQLLLKKKERKRRKISSPVFYSRLVSVCILNCGQTKRWQPPTFVSNSPSRLNFRNNGSKNSTISKIRNNRNNNYPDTTRSFVDSRNNPLEFLQLAIQNSIETHFRPNSCGEFARQRSKTLVAPLSYSQTRDPRNLAALPFNAIP